MSQAMNDGMSLGRFRAERWPFIEVASLGLMKPTQWQMYLLFPIPLFLGSIHTVLPQSAFRASGSQAQFTRYAQESVVGDVFDLYT